MIEAQGVSLTFQTADGPVHALKDVDLTIDKGEIFALLGPNGAGKTTLVLHLNGILTPTSGSVAVSGLSVVREHLLDVRRRVGIVFQDPASSLNPRMPIGQSIGEPMLLAGVALILATGGNAMVRAAYSCGKPALGVGAGNVPAFIERTAKVGRAVNDVVLSKSFEMGMVCASEQAVILDEPIAEEALAGLPYYTHPQSLHVWLPLPEGHTEDGFVSQARLRGVAIAPGSSFRTADQGWQPAVRISLGSTTEQELRTGLGILASLASGNPEALLLAI